MGSGGTMAWEPRSGGLKDRTAKDTLKKSKSPIVSGGLQFHRGG